METEGENDRAQRPVGKHTDPDSNRAESPYPAEINAQAYPAQPHGAAGGDHGEFYVTCSAHTIGWDEGKYPGNWLYVVMKLIMKKHSFALAGSIPASMVIGLVSAKTSRQLAMMTASDSQDNFLI